MRKLVGCPDGRITLEFEIADLLRNMGRIVGKTKAKEKDYLCKFRDMNSFKLDYY